MIGLILSNHKYSSCKLYDVHQFIRALSWNLLLCIKRNRWNIVLKQKSIDERKVELCSEDYSQRNKNIHRSNVSVVVSLLSIGVFGWCLFMKWRENTVCHSHCSHSLLTLIIIMFFCSQAYSTYIIHFVMPERMFLK